jgi:hypothetical protein
VNVKVARACAAGVLIVLGALADALSPVVFIACSAGTLVVLVLYEIHGNVAQRRRDMDTLTLPRPPTA